MDSALESGDAPSAEECPYYGVPFTLKDCIFVKGLISTAGIPARKNVVTTEDAVVVRRMKDAGGICLAVTNVSEVNQNSFSIIFSF